jgi:hypothetical protein
MAAGLRKLSPELRRDAVRAARALLTAIDQGIDPFDACDPEIEALAIKYSSEGGDAVIVLETAEIFMLAALRAIVNQYGDTE